MRRKDKTRGLVLSGCFTLAALLLAATPAARAQSARYLGTVAAIDGNTLTVKTDADGLQKVQVPATAILKRIAPGERDLTKAEPLAFGDLAVGDRVLVALDPAFTGTPPQALRIVAIKQADVARRQQEEKAAWNAGVHGLVKSVDPAAGAIVVTVREGLSTREVSIDTTPATVLNRYTPGSVRFDQAEPAPLASIHPGDQIWARGTQGPGGSAFAADAVVSGSFRSISGTVISADSAASTLTVKDLATKKSVTVRITSDAQLQRLDDRVAAFLAARLKAGPAGADGSRQHGFDPASSGAQNRWSQGGAAPRRMDFESILERAPRIRLGDLKKGDAVMLVAAEDASGLSAVKLLAGVEPLLEAPQAQDLLSSWSLNSGESVADQ